MRKISKSAARIAVLESPWGRPTPSSPDGRKVVGHGEGPEGRQVTKVGKMMDIMVLGDQKIVTDGEGPDGRRQTKSWRECPSRHRNVQHRPSGPSPWPTTFRPSGLEGSVDPMAIRGRRCGPRTWKFFAKPTLRNPTGRKKCQGPFSLNPAPPWHFCPLFLTWHSARPMGREPGTRLDQWGDGRYEKPDNYPFQRGGVMPYRDEELFPFKGMHVTFFTLFGISGR